MSTVEILFSRFQGKLTPSAWERWLAVPPPSLRQSILRYRRWQDQQLHLSGKLLLLEGAVRKRYSDVFESLQTDIHDRPFCDAPIDFNISHSGNLAVCAVGPVTVRLGIDVEKVDAIDLAPFGSYMTAGEWRRIESAGDRHRAFFTYWTIKESVMKADGRGMDIPLENIDVNDGFALLDGRRWRLHEIALDPDYVCHLAVDSPGVEITVREEVFD